MPTNKVDNKDVPVLHFGAILAMPEWLELRDHLLSKQKEGYDISFIIEPYIRFQGLPAEQATMVRWVKLACAASPSSQPPTPCFSAVNS